jgi:hypothetical protein
MKDINEYIKESYSERTKHLDLSTECREVGGNSTAFKGLLSHELGVTIPSSSKILLCHKCHNGKCSNPKHLYYGTPKENIEDQKENGTWMSVWERSVKKYGYEEACARNRFGNKAAGGSANKGKQKSEAHKAKIAESIKNKWRNSEYDSSKLGRKKSVI